MKKIMCLTVLLMSCLLFKAYADDAVLPEVHTKFCPISHEEVGKDGMKPFKVTYNGKVYSLCCSMCEKDFMKDPAKYAKMLDEQAVEETKKM